MWETPSWINASLNSAHSEKPVPTDVTGRILVVDDDTHFLRVLNRILSSEQFEVVTATSVAEAVSLFRQKPVDLIISDLRMPEQDGISFLCEIRQSAKDTPVIILTAYGEIDTYLEAMNAGANEYLNKPVNTDELLRIVRVCLQSKKGE
jgi:DNA-binding response OmpR family regulator